MSGDNNFEDWLREKLRCKIAEHYHDFDISHDWEGNGKRATIFVADNWDDLRAIIANDSPDLQIGDDRKFFRDTGTSVVKFCRERKSEIKSITT